MKNEDGLSDFMKFAYECNKVRDVKEAFEEYPVSQEWHEGKIENVLRESEVVYNSYEIGDIVFVKKYYYPDGSNGENHFFVIIDQNNVAVPIESFGMIISSNLDKLKYKANKLLEKDVNNGLHKDSIVKTDVIYKILDEQIIFKSGKVDAYRIEEYKNCFYENNKKEKSE